RFGPLANSSQSEAAVVPRGGEVGLVFDRFGKGIGRLPIPSLRKEAHAKLKPALNGFGTQLEVSAQVSLRNDVVGAQQLEPARGQPCIRVIRVLRDHARGDAPGDLELATGKERMDPDAEALGIIPQGLRIGIKRVNE